jgi:hypothetical protein
MHVAMLGRSQASPITIAMGVGHITTPITTGDHSSNGQMMLVGHCCYESEAFTSL